MERESTSAPVTSVDRHTGTETIQTRSPKTKQKGGERGTSAPVTSADRYTGTKEVKEGNAHKEKEKESRKEE